MVQSSAALDRTFAALADPTRRAILTSLKRSDGSITELAGRFEMTLTGLKKHVRVLEEAGLVTTQKRGRTRRCRLGPGKLAEASRCIATYQRMVEERLDQLEVFLEDTGETP
jgi:DNA-binding transcriptional ArsR family regulator